MAEPGATVAVGLRLELAPGWHSYWRNPGDVGVPTRIAWRLPPGVEAGPIQWPHPEAQPYGPLVNYGYAGDVLHVVDLTLPADWPAGTPVPVAAEASWLVCETVCIPEEATLDLTLPTGGHPEPDPATAALFERSRERLPQPAAFPVEASTDGRRLGVVLDGGFDRARVEAARFFPFEPGGVAPTAAQRMRLDGAGRLRLDVPVTHTPERLAGVVVLTERAGGRLVSRAISLETAVTAQSSSARLEGAALLGLALLGGALVNLLPWVLPVAATRALPAIRNAASRGARGRRALAHLAGGLAVALPLAVLAAGAAPLAWGRLLQTPVAVAGVAVLLALAGLDLVRARPRAQVDLGATAFWGAVTMAVAIAGTAPIVAAAPGLVAVEEPWWAIATVLAFALGVALPATATALVPGSTGDGTPARLWSGLGFATLGCAAWLVWVLAHVGGPDAVFATLAALALAAFGLWLAPLGGRATRASGAGALVVALALLVTMTALAERADVGHATRGERYGPARLEEALGGRGPVLVDMTAAWCITCQVNQRVALSGDGFERLLKATGTTYLIGDWTHHDPEITRYLDRFDHPGVPLYVVYDAAEGNARVLPQLLTPAVVRRALTDAAGAAPG